MRDWHQASQPLIVHCAPDGLTAAMTAQLDTYMQMLRLTTPAEPQISPRVRELAIAQLALDVYTAIQQPIIDADTMAVLQQRFVIEITDPQYRHDVGQYEVVYNDIFLDPEARVRALHERHSDEMRRQHSKMSTQIRLLHEEQSRKMEEQSRKMAEIYDKHGKYIEHQSQMFAETLAKHEQQMTHMRTTLEQEIHHLNDKIVAMKTEIDWRTHVAAQQQQTLDKLGWAIRIVAFGEHISRIIRKSQKPRG
jgi:ATP-dependent Lon protease